MPATNFKKASQAQKDAYWSQDQKPEYPLYGTVEVNGVECAVEGLVQFDKDDWMFEVIAPAGMKFSHMGSLSVLCLNTADIYERLSYETLIPRDESDDL